MVRDLKISDLMGEVRKCLDRGSYLDTRHAVDRQSERSITRPEILYVLKHGRHEAKKDSFDKLHGAWNYAIRGRTVDKRELRVIVSFDPAGMLIITAIDLMK